MLELNPNEKHILLIGGGGHCVSAIEVIEASGKYQIKGILDSEKNLNKEVSGYKITGTDQEIEHYCEKKYGFLITVGQIKNAQVRIKLFDILKQKNAEIETVISPLAWVSKRSEIKDGTIIMHKATVNAGSYIGYNCIINTGANVEHDTIIGDHCHISTHAVINGTCKIGNRVFIGSNSVLANNIEIGEDVIIGAGTVVNKSIYEPGIYAGNPAKKINIKLWKEF